MLFFSFMTAVGLVATGYYFRLGRPLSAMLYTGMALACLSRALGIAEDRG